MPPSPDAPGYGTAAGSIVAQFGSPAAPASLPHQRTSGPASENITARGCSRRTNPRSEEHTSELQSQSNLVCRLLLEKKKKKRRSSHRQSWTAVRMLLRQLSY